MASDLYSKIKEAEEEYKKLPEMAKSISESFDVQNKMFRTLLDEELPTSTTSLSTDERTRLTTIKMSMYVQSMGVRTFLEKLEKLIQTLDVIEISHMVKQQAPKE